MISGVVIMLNFNKKSYATLLSKKLDLVNYLKIVSNKDKQKTAFLIESGF